ncbi:competence/damage-inducible protein A [Gordonia alkaliphila]|uniref:competence/damage-inducible protein A n=1 Tax=Gordonia alkaliphila TaxID=1053547 RepID=UPI001FF2C003|nr:competence/damage-inducible protein A [Gordonia alkaliphila]MCK0440674.1 competence/damage-inducible protein A [Gordonia alkaliphila]
MSVRAAILVTGTEVLHGQISDQNGPWVAERLLEYGLDVAHVTICGDRPEDMAAQLRFLTEEGVDLIVTTGGLGPTADDLTVPTVAEFCGRDLVLDRALEADITTIIRNWRRFADDHELAPALTAAIAKQALVPIGASPIPPTGTAPGVAIPADQYRPTILILPGPPRELQAMWPAAVDVPAIAAVLARGDEVEHRKIRAYGLSEADLAQTLRRAESDLPGFRDLEVTTCMRLGEVEIDTRFATAEEPIYDALKTLLHQEHSAQIFSADGAPLDELLAVALAGHTIATAESCTGGLVAARLTDRPGSSSYVLGGIVSYANEVKSGVLGVPAALIGELGAVSEPVASAMAEGARARTGATVAVSTTGIAGPGGAVPGKPVGTVCFGLAIDGEPTRTVTRTFPGDRTMVRTLATTFALHLVLGALT